MFPLTFGPVNPLLSGSSELVLSGLANSCVGNFSLIRLRNGRDTLVNRSALRSPLYMDARDFAVTKIVPECNVFISLRTAWSEKQIPRFIGECCQMVLSFERQSGSRLQSIHLGLRATHTRRPCQISWCENWIHFSCGRILIRSCSTFLGSVCFVSSSRRV